MARDPRTIDLSRPQYDQRTYYGRAAHFFKVTNPLNLLASNEQLEEAKKIVTTFKQTRRMPQGYDEDKLWATKYLYDSAFHPDTGEKMMLIGRMSAQVPMNALIVGGMITFYRSTAGTVFWQWINQSFNALVNYTNRSGDAPISQKQLITSYLGATGGALATALYLNSKVKNMNPVLGRLVPFAAVCMANFINIPLMRSQELMHGTPVFSPDEQRARLGDSVSAARWGIFLVCISRIIMAMPGMTITPVITNWAIKKGWFCRRPWLVVPFQIGSVALCVTFATPLACALFDQQATIKVDQLDKELQDKIKKTHPKIDHVVFNKGL